MRHLCSEDFKRRSLVTILLPKSCYSSENVHWRALGLLMGLGFCKRISVVQYLMGLFQTRKQYMDQQKSQAFRMAELEQILQALTAKMEVIHFGRL